MVTSTPVIPTDPKFILKQLRSLAKENKFEIRVETAHKFINQFQSNANKFGWVPLVFQVQTLSNPDKFVNVFENHEYVQLLHMICHANITWGTVGNDFNSAIPNNKAIVDLTPAPGNTHIDLFYKRAKRVMIVEWIKRYLKLSDWENLQNDSVDFTWTGT